MIPRQLLAMLVLLLVFTGCGGDDDGDSEADASEPTATTQSQSGSATEADDEGDSGDAEQEVDADYLQGEWCSTQESDPEGTSYVFDGNAFEYGRPGSLSPGGNIPTFLIGVKIVSVEDDEFVATKFGREIVFTRGECS